MTTVDELEEAIKQVYDKDRVTFADRVKILDMLTDIRWQIEKMRKVVETLHMIANEQVADDYERDLMLAEAQEAMAELEIEVD